MALIYYAYGIQLPAGYSPQSNKHLRVMWTELARMGTMGNDMLSMRREVMHGQFESLIPLLMFHEHLAPQAAMERAATMLHGSYRRFNESEQMLYEEVDPQDLDVVKSCVQACKDLIVCNLHWSYGLKRYMEKDMLQPDGSVKFTIPLPGQYKDRKPESIQITKGMEWVRPAVLALVATSIVAWCLRKRLRLP